MKKLIVFILMSPLLLVGCQMTPAQQALTATTTLTTVISGLNLAYSTGKLTTADMQALAPFVAAANAAVQTLNADAANGSTSVTADEQALSAALTTLSTQEAAILAKHASTQPTK